MKFSHALLVVCLTSLLAGCGGSTESDNLPTEREAILADISSSTGLDFRHDIGDTKPFFMPRCVGSGVALFDYNADGLLDLYFVQNAGAKSTKTNKLYRQKPDGTYENVTSDSNLGVAGHGMGVAAADVNNDGKVDLLLNEYGRSRLFLNRTVGDAPQFEDVTSQAGIKNRFWGTSTCFVDIDRDGWLDIVLVNYVNYDPSRWCAGADSKQDFCGPDAFPGRPSKLYRNLGATDDGTLKFEDVTKASGFADKPAPGLGVFCADFDGDRWPDIFIANDGQPNHLWINQKDGTFREDATLRGLAYNSMGKTEADMGIAIGDVDGNGLFDIFVTHLTTETHTLWRQEKRGVFQDQTSTSGLTAAKWRGTGFGTIMADLNNDGALDLAVANGRVTKTTSSPPKSPDGLSEFWQSYAERDQILLNDGSGHFMDASESNPAFSGVATVSRGLACGDVNNDGAMDLIVTNITGEPRVFRNTNQQGGWLLVQCFEPDLNRDAIGAEVYVDTGEQTLMRWTNPGYSYLCSNDPRAHFGLGDIQEIDRIRVVWPDGSEERFPGGSVNRIIELRHGEGEAIEAVSNVNLGGDH